MIPAADLVMVGKVNKTHGINGELSVSFFSNALMQSIAPDTCLIFYIDGIPTPFYVDAVRPRSAESILLSIDGLASQEKAAMLVGHDVYMFGSETLGEEDDEAEGFFAGQLIGFQALDGDNDSVIGEIVDIDDNTENVLFIVQRPDESRIFIPVADDLISDINPEEKTITFDLPEGLLNI